MVREQLLVIAFIILETMGQSRVSVLWRCLYYRGRNYEVSCLLYRVVCILEVFIGRGWTAPNSRIITETSVWSVLKIVLSHLMFGKFTIFIVNIPTLQNNRWHLVNSNRQTSLPLHRAPASICRVAVLLDSILTYNVVYRTMSVGVSMQMAQRSLKPDHLGLSDVQSQVEMFFT